MSVKGEKKVFQTKLTDVASSDKEGVGTVRKEGDDEYIWLKGVASTVAYAAVCYDEDYATALLTETLAAKGKRVAFAQAAIVADKYGWYQIRGVGKVRCLASCAKESVLYATSTAGCLDDAGTTKIHGVISTETEGGTGTDNLICQIQYPHSLI